jgi:hypothetical protein
MILNGTLRQSNAEVAGSPPRIPLLDRSRNLGCMGIGKRFHERCQAEQSSVRVAPTQKVNPTILTFVGKFCSEAKMLALAKAYQDATEWHLKHSKLG